MGARNSSLNLIPTEEMDLFSPFSAEEETEDEKAARGDFEDELPRFKNRRIIYNTAEFVGLLEMEEACRVQ